MTSTIICTIEVREEESSKPITVIGEVSSTQLFDKENAWISMRTKVQQESGWKTAESIIYKPSIEKITFLAEECYISLNKEELGLYLSIISSKS